MWDTVNACDLCVSWLDLLFKKQGMYVEKGMMI